MPPAKSDNGFGGRWAYGAISLVTVILIIAIVYIGSTFLNRADMPDGYVVSQGDGLVNEDDYMCTTGATWSHNGSYYAAMAGHCGAKGASVRLVTSSGVGPVVGEVVSSVFSGDLDSQRIMITPSAADWAIVQLLPQYSPEGGSVKAENNPYGDVYHALPRNEAVSSLTSLCVYGARTAHKVCGSVDRSQQVGDFLVFTPLSGKVNKGDSGGPAFDEDGRFVGVISAQAGSVAYVYLITKALENSGLL